MLLGEVKEENTQSHFLPACPPRARGPPKYSCPRVRLLCQVRPPCIRLWVRFFGSAWPFANGARIARHALVHLLLAIAWNSSLFEVYKVGIALKPGCHKLHDVGLPERPCSGARLSHDS